MALSKFHPTHFNLPHGCGEGKWEFFSTERRWIAFDHYSQDMLEHGFLAGMTSVTLSSEHMVIFMAGTQLNTKTQQHRPIRRTVAQLQDELARNPNLTITFRHEHGHLQTLDIITAVQILTWPLAQAPQFRPFGQFYLTAGYAYMIDLVTMTQINLSTKTSRPLTCPAITAAIAAGHAAGKAAAGAPEPPPYKPLSTIRDNILRASEKLISRLNEWHLGGGGHGSGHGSHGHGGHGHHRSGSGMLQGAVPYVPSTSVASTSGSLSSLCITPSSSSLSARRSAGAARGPSEELKQAIQQPNNAALVGSLPARTRDLVLKNAALWPEAKGGECVICCEQLSDTEENGVAVRLCDCDNHGFHFVCIASWFQSSGKCPMCAKIYEVLIGNQPEDGKMEVLFKSDKLPGFETTSEGTFIITYEFPDGVQTNKHPHPGRPYTGDRRLAYLPKTLDGDGEEILQLLRVAWDRRLIFTVGESTTLGPAAGDRIIWNGIHHKTQLSGAHGYPDSTYLTRVREELATMGIT